MVKDKLDPFTASATPKKTRQPFVQAESELIEARLEAIADGLMKLTDLYSSFQKVLICTAQPEGTEPTNKKSSQLKLT